MHWRTIGLGFLIAGSILVANWGYLSDEITILPQNCLQFGDASAHQRSSSVRVGRTCAALWEEKWTKHQSYLKHLAQAEASRSSTMQDWNEKRAYDMYEPEWVCEADVRVGPSEVNIGDGPKFVCAPDMLRYVQDCLVYSIGSNYDFQFEQGLGMHAPNCEFHTFDGTMDLSNRALPPGLEEKNIHFHNWNLGVTSEVDAQGKTTKSIGDIVNELGHKGRKIHVLKLDCEGCEYQVLPDLMEYIKARDVEIDQIQVEMHGVDAAPVQQVFQSLRGANFALFHKERNHWGCKGYLCVEFSFVSKQKAKEVFEQERCIQGDVSKGDAAEDDQDPWWFVPYQQSLGMGPIQIQKFPYPISESNDVGLMQLLCYAGGFKEKNAFIDIGLPTESLHFAAHGHTSEAFEARKEGYDSVKKLIEENGLQDQINLHNMALSNSTGTIKIYEARDSSSLLKSAVDVGPELQKRHEEGMKETMVNTAPLDTFVSEADAMKIDTQGVEPEIFMGAQKVLNSGLPFPILMEYCSRLRSFQDLSVGVHILRGLGYQCYTNKAFILDQSADFCGDFYCAKNIKQANCDEQTVQIST